MSSAVFQEAVDGSTEPRNKKKRSVNVLPTHIKTRSTAIQESQPMEETETPPNGENIVAAETSPTQNLTSKDSNSPDENALVNFDRQRTLIISFFLNILYCFFFASDCT